MTVLFKMKLKVFSSTCYAFTSFLLMDLLQAVVDLYTYHISCGVAERLMMRQIHRAWVLIPTIYTFSINTLWFHVTQSASDGKATPAETVTLTPAVGVARQAAKLQCESIVVQLWGLVAGRCLTRA